MLFFVVKFVLWLTAACSTQRILLPLRGVGKIAIKVIWILQYLNNRIDIAPFSVPLRLAIAQVWCCEAAKLLQVVLVDQVQSLIVLERFWH